MNKKIALSAAVALLVAAYGGTTWYTGQRAEASHTEALELVRKHLGPEAVVEQQYKKGFLSSQSHVVLQWAPPASAGEQAGATAASKPIKVVLDTTVRHGPLAGGHIAAAVAETRISIPDVHEDARKLFEKASAPTLTTVRKLTGGHRISVNLPAGEIAKDGLQLRWQKMLTQVDINATGDRVQSSVDWPELVVNAAPSGSETPARRAGSQSLSVVIQGVSGTSDQRIEDGLWLVAPGQMQVQLDKLEVAQLGDDLSVAKVLATFQKMTLESEVERTGDTMGMTTTAKSKGAIGTVNFENLGFKETWARIDRQAVQLFQQAMVSIYVDGLAQNAETDSQQFTVLMKEIAPRFVANLPTYSLKVMATIEGQEGEVGYGAEIQSAPSAAAIENAGGLGLALLNTSKLSANARIPKAWLPSIAKTVMGNDMKPEEIDAMVNMAQSGGYAQVEGNTLVSALVYEKGQAKLNGQAIAVPGMPR